MNDIIGGMKVLNGGEGQLEKAVTPTTTGPRKSRGVVVPFRGVRVVEPPLQQGEKLSDNFVVAGLTFQTVDEPV